MGTNYQQLQTSRLAASVWEKAEESRGASEAPESRGPKIAKDSLGSLSGYSES